MELALLRNFGVVDGVALFLALLGTVLYILEVYVFFRRPKKIYEEWISNIALTGFMFFFLGNFLVLFARALIADVANAMYRIGWIISTAGFVFIPSLLLHAYGTNFLFAKAKLGPKERGPRNIPPNIVLASCHLVGIYILFSFFQDLTGTAPLPYPNMTTRLNTFHFRILASWLSISCIIVGIFSFGMMKTPGWEKWKKYFPINGVFFLLSSIIVIIVLWQHPWTPESAPWVRIIFLSIAFFPGVVLAYYLVQYQFMHIFVKPSLIYAVLTGLIVLIYQLGIRNFSMYLSQFPAVNVELVEFVMLLGLIFMAQPARVKLQARVNALFFKEGEKYREAVHSISNELKSGLILDRVLKNISDKLEQVLMVDKVDLILVKSPPAERFIQTTKFLETLEDPVLFVQSSFGKVTKEMERAGAELVVGILERKEILGLISVGSKLYNQQISNNEVHLLRTVANQLIVSARYTALVEEQLRLERLMIRQEKLSTLGQITASITHEVKNPLSSINTLVQVMQEEQPKGEDLQDDLRTIEDEVAHLNNVLSEILKYAKPDSMELQSVAVNDVIRDVTVLLEKEARNCGIELIQFEIRDVHIIATLDGLKEVIFNLVFNAIQACDDKGGFVRILTEVMDEELLIIIRDSGRGIPEDQLNRIFEPFYTTKEKGSGLGLTIVKEKVEKFNGKVSARNLAGGGAEFSVRFPISKGGIPFNE